jgi:hypothetical protein
MLNSTGRESIGASYRNISSHGELWRGMGPTDEEESGYNLHPQSGTLLYNFRSAH